jgi:hypothetical protein
MPATPTSREGFIVLRFFWQLTHQSLPMRPTPWRQTVGSAPRSPSLGYFTIQSIKRLYVAQQLRGTAGAWWASYITALPIDHHVPWGEFHTAFHAHHLSAGLLRTKLKEFLDLELGNHSIFD